MLSQLGNLRLFLILKEMNQFSQLSTFPVFDQLPEARIMADIVYCVLPQWHLLVAAVASVCRRSGICL
jgi:hypothetical protein